MTKEQNIKTDWISNWIEIQKKRGTTTTTIFRRIKYYISVIECHRLCLHCQVFVLCRISSWTVAVAHFYLSIFCFTDSKRIVSFSYLLMELNWWRRRQKRNDKSVNNNERWRVMITKDSELLSGVIHYLQLFHSIYYWADQPMNSNVCAPPMSTANSKRKKGKTEKNQFRLINEILYDHRSVWWVWWPLNWIWKQKKS